MGVSRTGNGNYVAQTITATLGADVSLAQNNYTDILSVSLVPGVWLVYGFVNTVASATQDTTIRISDGTNHYASTSMSHDSGYDYSHSLFARIVLTATTTIKLQGTRNSTGTVTANKAVSTNSAGNNATQLLALKLDSSNPIGVVGGFAPLDSNLLIPSTYIPQVKQAYVGYNTIGASWESNAQYKQIAKQITISNDCLITSIGAYMQITGLRSVGYTVQLLTDSSGTPDLAIAAGEITYRVYSANNPRWLDIPLGAWVTAGTYWISWDWNWNETGSGSPQIAYDSGGSDKYITPAFSAQVTEFNGQSITTSSNRYSIRANTIR